MRESFTEITRLEPLDMSRLACMADESFSRFFRNKTGRTPNRYLIDYRLGIAASRKAVLPPSSANASKP
jgi:transcriptional regulator GlxA family with amidase domain